MNKPDKIIVSFDSSPNKKDGRILSASKIKDKIAFYLEDVETPIGLIINFSILGLIFLSSGIFVLQTYPISVEINKILDIVDIIILIIFSIEYCLRFWVAENKSKFFWSLFSLVDCLSIAPLLLGLTDIRFFRLFRWFRILRIIRFWKLETSILGIKSEDSIVFIRIFLTLFCLIFIYAGLIYQVEYRVSGNNLDNFFDALYFVVVTMTTVGYGDVTPLSQAGRAMTLLMILTGVLFLPWQFSELIKQVLKTANLVEKECHVCNLSRHDPDADYCKKCGSKLMNKKQHILDEKF